MRTGTVIARRGRQRGGLAAACIVAVLLGPLLGCGTQAANVALPSKPGPGKPGPGRPGHVRVDRVRGVMPSARRLVIAAYEGYWRATNEALASRDAARARAILAGHVPAGAAPALVRGFRAIWRRNEIGYGSPVFHIMSVTITGYGRAAVHDCVDLSRTGFANPQTGHPVGGHGSSHDFLITTLALEQGRWLVTGAIPVGQTCGY
jgi:hypothetical protein